MEAESSANLVKSRSGVVFVAALVLLAAALRVPGLFTDFWFDEIWSWTLVPKLHSIADILLSEPARIDNNHPLNTLWMYLLGPAAAVWLYRLPALLAGIGSVVVAWHLMARRSKPAGIIAATLMAVSYPMVFYSSEARGYSAVVFFALLSLDAIELAMQGSWRDVALFNVACVLGFYSHLTFLFAYFAAMAVSVVHILRHREMPGRVRWLVSMHAIPIAAVAVLYWTFAKHMVIGGAAPTVPGRIILSALSLVIGGSKAGTGAAIAGGLGAIILLASLVRALGRFDAVSIYALVAGLLAPLVICGQEQLLSPRPQPLMMRYFLVCLAVLLMPVAECMGELWNRAGHWRMVIGAALALFVVGNAWQLFGFYRDGRGQYAAALARIAQQDPSEPIRVGSKNAIHLQYMLDFYGPRMRERRGFQITDDEPQWMILSGDSPQASAVVVERDREYALVEVNRCEGLSGWCCYVYRQK